MTRNILNLIGCLPKYATTGVVRFRHVPARFSSTSKSQDKEVPVKQEPTEPAKSRDDDSKLGENSKETFGLQAYTIPDENPDLPKKHVFQQLNTVKLHDPVYTLQQAAAYKDPDSITKSHKYPTLSDQMGTLDYYHRSWDNEYSVIAQFPDATDFIMVGGGLIGSAAAYYAKKTVSRSIDIVVIDKDPYSPHNTTSFSNGLISCQSKSRDVSRIAILSKELIRNLRRDILVTDDDYAQIKYRPCTHLILWTEREADEALKAVMEQTNDGCFTVSKLPEELELNYPWLKVANSDVFLGTHGQQDEALYDPVGLRNLYRTLAQAHGANFIQAEFVDFNTQYNKDVDHIHALSAGSFVARMTNQELKVTRYAKVLLCNGHMLPFSEAQAEMEDTFRDSIQDLHFIQPMLRICLVFTSHAAPIINFPVITDTDGTMLLRDDYAGSFKYYLTMEESEEFFRKDNARFMNLDSSDPYVNLIHKPNYFEDYFNDVVKPKLVKRIPVMADAKLRLAQSGFESYNTHDGSPVLGNHPFHMKIVISGGYGNRMSLFAPCVGASLSELLVFDEELTFDCKNFYWDRVLGGRKISEFNSILGKSPAMEAIGYGS